MKKALTVLVLLGLGAASGRPFDGAPPRAEARDGDPLPPCQDINGDGKSNLTDAVFLLNWLFRGGTAPICPTNNAQAPGLPDTGQGKCYDAAGDEIPCDSATCPGQHGAYTTGCASEGRFVDNGDGTVTDNCTGLMWQQDTADVNGDGQVTFESDRVNWCEALAYCENLELAGDDDWRLPNMRELESIVDYGRVDPAIEPVFGAFSEPYWSSTIGAYNPVVAWIVGFGAGDAADAVKGAQIYVRAVRRGP